MFKGMFKGKRTIAALVIWISMLLLPQFVWAGGGATGWIDAGTFALVVQLGIGLAAIFAGWVVKEKLGIRIPKMLQAVIIWILAYVIMRVILQPPIPFHLLALYMGVITVSIFLYVSLDQESWEDFNRPIQKLFEEDTAQWKWSRRVTFTAIPAIIGFSFFDYYTPKFAEPIELRTVHPAPPATAQVHGTTFTLQTAENPYRVGEDGKYLPVGAEGKFHGQNSFAPDAPKFLQAVRDGGVVFFGTAGCFFCHGDNLDGKGPFAFAFNPIPANFADPGTIAQVQETFAFWRVAKGGPGLPREGFPWASAMPPWEEHLTVDEIWKAIIFEYWHTNFFPRTWD